MLLHFQNSATGKEVGNRAGFGRSAFSLRQALGKLVTLDPWALGVLHYCAPQNFKPTPGRLNVLFSMVENRRLEPQQIEGLRRANLIVAPSAFCASVFRKHTDVPVEVVPLGVDLESFPYKRRRYRRDKPFRLLFVGAPNPRKWTIIPRLWREILPHMPNVELYLKTTAADLSSANAEAMRSQGATEIEDGLWRGENWFLDSRTLLTGELSELYHSSHLLISPHCGEGFGLTPLEAMASGTPVAVTGATGSLEYCDDENAYLIDSQILPIEMGTPTGGTQVEMVPWPRLESLVGILEDATGDYRKALKKSRNAKALAEELTWQGTASRLCRTLDRYGIREGRVSSEPGVAP